MEDTSKNIESLYEKATEFGKAGYELGKLKVVDKTSDVVSSFIPHYVVFVLAVSFLVFLNLGLAIWLGEIVGRIFYGFFIVAGFYGLAGIFVHFFMHKRLKKFIGNNIIKLLLR
ncbi:MAG: hypothetical protein K0B05_01420 [Bacteroidales bacterium]|nr:hypothetical protein [Bacteroidales bacterium]